MGDDRPTADEPPQPPHQVECHAPGLGRGRVGPDHVDDGLDSDRHAVAQREQRQQPRHLAPGGPDDAAFDSDHQRAQKVHAQHGVFLDGVVTGHALEHNSVTIR
ncbi:hypothetical protein GCM10029992_48260 [Glycomyces albus]